MKKVAATMNGNQWERDLAGAANMKTLKKMAGPLTDPLCAGVYKKPWKRACCLAFRLLQAYQDSAFLHQKQRLYKIDRSFCFWLQLVTLVTK
ncbi:hypothetical protein [Collimonas pratensis]|uniref:hypothetical protein n=1 Tax=Collimonas pratensis TaxID=279113 RepID=UPI00143D3D54|nr:hypothetical protein [Collimonas pratensis]